MSGDEQQSVQTCDQPTATGPTAPGVWFEITTLDLERAKAFYETVLQVTLQPWQVGQSPRMMMFPCGGPDSYGSGGALVEQVCDCQPSTHGSTVYLSAGDDLAPALARVEPAGGKVVIPKTAISPEIGYFAQFIDSEGNRVGLHSRH